MRPATAAVVTLLSSAAALLVIGLLTLWSASYQSAEYGEGISLDYHVKQLRWIGVGLVVGAIAAAIRPSWWEVASRPLWLGGIALLILTAVAGTEINGSKRWLNLGLMMLQPSELVKLGVVLALAAHLARTGPRIVQAKSFLLGWWPVSVPFVLILLQPDLGTSLVLIPIAFAMLLGAGARLRHVGAVILCGMVMSVPAYVFALKPYQKARLTAFINKDDPAVARNEGYQMRHSQIAVGAGGIAGRGWFQGTQGQLNFLPERHTDFIFAVVAEEWGFVGCCGVLAAFLAFLLSIVRIAALSRGVYERTVASGLFAYFGFQMFQNIGMASGMMPITGLTLPFFSYGGSSMLISLVAVGWLVGIALRLERRI